MPQARENDRFSYGDALFLYLEREGMPLNVASVNVFEGEIPFKTCVEFIESKLPLIPRYRQRVVFPAFNLGLPRWEHDPDFDIHNHVRQVTLERGTEAEFKAVAGKILSPMLDRQRPLWDFTLVRGLKGNRTGVVTRMHHCLADGLAGVELLNVLMDPSPEVHPLPASKGTVRVHRRKSSPSLLDELITSTSSVAERVLTAQRELLDVLQHVLRAASHDGEIPASQQPGPAPFSTGDEFARFMPEISGSTQRLPFNIICRGPQKFRWAEIPLSEIKAIKQACGVTVNDVVLTLVTSAIQRYVEQQGVSLRGRLLRIVVPVNIRGNGSASELGNRITFLPITIPLDIHNVRRLVTAIRERMVFLKSAHMAELVSVVGTVLGAIPSPAQVVIGPIVSQLPLGLCNTICTNVPGPALPLYLLGHKMLCCYPYVPIGGDIGINCAVLTYNGTAFFGFTGDAHAAPDLGRLEKYLRAAFSELRNARGVRAQRLKRKAATKKAKASAAVAPTAGERVTTASVIPMPVKSAEAPEPTEQTQTHRMTGVAV